MLHQCEMLKDAWNFAIENSSKSSNSRAMIGLFGYSNTAIDIGNVTKNSFAINGTIGDSAIWKIYGIKY